MLRSMAILCPVSRAWSSLSRISWMRCLLLTCGISESSPSARYIREFTSIRTWLPSRSCPSRNLFGLFLLLYYIIIMCFPCNDVTLPPQEQNCPGQFNRRSVNQLQLTPCKFFRTISAIFLFFPLFFLFPKFFLSFFILHSGDSLFLTSLQINNDLWTQLNLLFIEWCGHKLWPPLKSQMKSKFLPWS